MRSTSRDAGRAFPQGVSDRGGGDAVPSLDWHAAAGQGLSALTTGAGGHQGPSAGVSGNASKVRTHGQSCVVLDQAR